MEGRSLNSMEGGMERGPESKEHEPKPTTRVVLEIMRHGKREKGATPQADANPDLRLTQAGREQATAKGEALDPQTEVALGWGSSRTRAQETAYRTMLANEDILPTDTFEQIEEKIAQELPYGKKMIVDDRLGFGDGGPIEAALMKAFTEKRFLPWVVSESDREAIAAGDTVSPTLTRNAGNIAEIVRRYATVGNNFEKLVAQDDTEKYAATGNRLERYLGTHQGIAESFLAKVLELTKGEEARDEFVRSVGTGFGETEGVRVEIVNQEGNQEIIMTYTLKDAENGDHQESVRFTADLLDQIIAQKQEFEALVRTEKTE